MAGFTFNTRSRSSTGPMGIGQRIFMSLFFSVFFLMGLFFEYMMVRDVAKAFKTYGWPATSCEILEADVEDKGGENPYNFTVAYAYRVDGRQYTSTTFKHGNARFSDYGKASRLKERYQPGTKGECFVDPRDPNSAILERKSRAGAFGLLFPLIFVAIGGGGIVFVWRGASRKAEEKKDKAPISAKASKGKGTLVACLFFSVFLLMGAAFFIGFFVRPALKILAAKGWQEVPCVVESSRVRSHSSDDGTTYSVDILYRYDVDGRTLKSNRYTFMGGSSSGRSGKQAVVKRHPPGSEHVCYVNPSDPLDAVLNRRFVPAMFFGLIPLIFVLVGGGGILITLKKAGKRADQPDRPSWLPLPGGRTANAMGQGGGLELKPKHSPLGKFIGLLIFGLIWNSVVGVLVTLAWKSMKRGRTEVALVVFAVIFGLIGLGVIAGLIHALLGLTNPRPVLTVNANEIPLGGPLEVKWQIIGNARRLTSLMLALEGVEEAQYRRGTDTHTDRNTFATIPIVETSAQREIAAGKASLSVPANTMHSFEAANNKIIWKLKLHADIPNWPDVAEEFGITILPSELSV